MSFKIELPNIGNLIKKFENFCITFHTSPDPDAFFSAIALKVALERKGKNVKLVSPNEVSNSLKNFLITSHEITIAENNPDKAKSAFLCADVVFFLDLSQIKRLGNVIESFFYEIKAMKIVVDHHINPDKSMADIFIHNDKASSTCELIQYMLEILFLMKSQYDEIADLLYAGIVSDTGNFSYSNTTVDTFKQAADLVRYGADPSIVSDKLNNNKSANWIKFLGFAFSEKLEFIYNEKVVFIKISQEDIKKFNVDYEEVGDLLHHLLSIKSIELVVLAKEKGDEYRLSFRSKGKIDVASFSGIFFEGGGHIRAAGGVYKGEKDKLRETILSSLETIKQNIVF